MRFSQSLLLASVAVLALPSCSSAKGPGEIGTTNDIVVRNYGDAPAQPSAATLTAPEGSAEAMLQQEAGTPPDMMAARTGDAVPADVAAQAQQAQDQAAQLQAQAQDTAAQVQAGQTQMQQQAALAQQQAQAAAVSGMEAVPAPAVEPQSLAEQATQTMPAQDMAAAAQDAVRPPVATAGVISPDVNAGLETRAAPQVDQPGAVIADVNAPTVNQAADQFQQKGTAQAAAEALQNPPTPSNAIVDGRAAPRGPNVNTQAVDSAPAPAPAAAVAAPSAAAPATAYAARTSLRPTAEDIANGGMRVVTTNDGQQVEKPYQAAPAQQAAPVAPATAPAPATQTAPSAPAPVAMHNGAPVMDKAMIAKAQGVLAQQGLYTGPADGVMSTATLNALSRYQSANQLTPGAMTVETAKHMGLVQ